jgi:hypothetical protein
VWYLVVIGLAPSVVAVAAIVTAELRDLRRLKQEREGRLRDERISAYRRLLVATTTAHVDRAGVAALSEAYAEISLLARSDELDSAAARVWTSYENTQKVSARTQKQSTNPSAIFQKSLKRAEADKDQFLQLAREELQVKPTQPSRGRTRFGLD